MNKFETRLLETLSSIDESLKALAAGKALAAKPAKKAAAKKAVPKVAKVKPAKAGNGALPEAVAKATVPAGNIAGGQS